MLLFITSSLMLAQENAKVEPVLNDFEELIKVRDFTINSNTNEAYFTLQSMNENISVIVKTEKIDNAWSQRDIVEFSGKYKDLEPMLSPDGLKLYFVSNRPLSDSIVETKDFDIWYVQRKTLHGKWSSPINLGAPVNTGADEFYPSVTTNGNLYFTRPNPKNKSQDDIFFSEFSDNFYSKPLVLSDSINTEGYEFNSYIAPDESFLLFSGYNREDGLGSGDLYISYRSEDGSWSKAENLGTSINSDQMDYCPFVDISNQRLYFTSRRASFQENPSENYQEVLKMINSYENGLSRIYKVDFSEYLKPNK